jgi:hypothetical protein
VDATQVTNVFFTVQRTPTRELNFLPHTWCFPYVQPMEKVGYENNQSVGLFSFAGSQAKPVRACHWNAIGPHQVHIHPQKGGMCFSPNNGHIAIENVCFFVSSFVYCHRECTFVCLYLDLLTLRTRLRASGRLLRLGYEHALAYIGSSAERLPLSNRHRLTN